MVEVLLGVLSFITAFVSGVVGFGGGMLLIAFLPLFLNPALIIPIHGATQLASNGSRMLFSIKHVKWALLPKYLIGSLLGIVIFGFVITSINAKYLPLAIGMFILINLWVPFLANLLKRFDNYYLIGLLQTGLGLVVGATGPLSLAVLTKQLPSKDQIIATSALFMGLSHLIKIIFFGLIGVSVFENITLLVFMVLGVILGSFVGTKLRLALPNELVIKVIKALLTLMATYMIASVVFKILFAGP